MATTQSASSIELASKSQDRLHSKQAFLDALTVISGRKNTFSLDMSAMLSGLDHSGRISSDITIPEDHGLYIDEAMYDDLKVKHQLPHAMEFSDRPLSEIGRSDSHNLVFFGDLDWRNYGRNPDFIARVAVKPMLKVVNERRALHEYTIGHYVAGMGIDTVKHFGIIRSRSGLFMLSHFRPELRTLDQKNWEGLSNEETDQTVKRGLESLVALHSVGVFHGDAALKNLTDQPDRKKVGVVDLEYSVSKRDTYKAGDLYSPVGILRAVCNDLSTVIKSLKSHGVINKNDGGDDFQKSYDLVLSQYSELLFKHPNPTPILQDIRANIGVIEALFYNEAIAPGEIQKIDTIALELGRITTEDFVFMACQR